LLREVSVSAWQAAGQLKEVPHRMTAVLVVRRIAADLEARRTEGGAEGLERRSAAAEAAGAAMATPLCAHDYRGGGGGGGGSVYVLVKT
jgi:hypothetical protein